MPVKPEGGVYCTLPLSASAVPWPEVSVASVIVRGSAFGSESLTSTSMRTAVPEVAAAVSFCATGGKLPSMVTVTVALAVPPEPSLMA